MKKIISMFVIIMMFTSWSYAEDLEEVYTDIAEYIYETVDEPVVGSVGGEWAVLGLSRSTYEVSDEYYDTYFQIVEEYVMQKEGLLHSKKYTEYSRLTVALTSIGKDPRDVAGCNLLTPLGDYDKTIWQGINGPIWALIALDSGNYDMPINDEAKIQATREMYVDRILTCQLDNGGFSLFGGTDFEASGNGHANSDITGMALQALANYQDREDVKQATNKALECLSEMQNDEGGFSSWGNDTSESCVQVLIGLCALGIDVADERFVKNENTILDKLMTFYQPNDGFLHVISGGGINLMASEQAFYGLVAYDRFKSGKNHLYDMSDVTQVEDRQDIIDVNEKSIKIISIKCLGKTFEDVEGKPYAEYVEALAQRDIIKGKSENLFDPDKTMTRAEFATVVVKALGLETVTIDIFEDVSDDSWYAGYVGAAYNNGIINGRSKTRFDPMGVISNEEAAVMVSKAANLTGLYESLAPVTIKDMLAQFIDYMKVSSWAKESVAFCYSEDILSQDMIEILPKANIKRYEVAMMIYHLLDKSNLLED